jgi:hypothetical protein
VKKERIHPDLRRQIEAAAGKAQPITAVYTIHTGPAALPGPETVKARVASLLDKVAEQTGRRPLDVQVFDNLASFAVQAPAEFVARLAQRREIATATPA